LGVLNFGQKEACTDSFPHQPYSSLFEPRGGCGLRPMRPDACTGSRYARHDESRQQRERDSRLGLCTSTAVHECRGPALSLSESAGPGSEPVRQLGDHKVVCVDRDEYSPYRLQLWANGLGRTHRRDLIPVHVAHIGKTVTLGASGCARHPD
jgi:hypothetical protein